MKNKIEEIKSRLSTQLIKNSGIYVISNFFIKGISFLMVPLYTKYLSPSEYGEVSLYMLYSTIIYLVLSLQNYSTIGVVKQTLNKNEFREYLANICLIPLVMFLIMISLVKVFGEFIYLKIGLNVFYQNMLIVQSFFYTGFTMLNSVYIYENKSTKKVRITLLFTFGVTILSILSIILINNKVLARIYSYFIICTLVGLYSYSKILKIKLIYRARYIKLCLKIGVPLIFYSLSYFLLNSADRIILKEMTTDLEVGLYSLAYNIGIITNLIWSSINSAWTPWLYNKMKNLNEEEIIKKSYIYLKIMIIINILFISLGIDFFKLLVPNHYLKSFDIIPWIVLGNVFVFFYSFSINYKTFNKKTKSISIISFITLVLNISLNIYLIPKYGATGAAITTAFSYFIAFVIFEIELRLNYKMKYFEVIEYLEYILYMFLTIFFYYVLNNYLVCRAILNIFLIILIIKRKKREEEVRL